MMTNIGFIRERKIGSHWLTLAKYRDDDNDMEFYGIAVDCVVQFKGTLDECEGKWRQWVKCLNHAHRRSEGRKKGGV